MNAVISSVGIMLILSFARVNIVLSLLLGAIIGGVVSGLELNTALTAFSSGLGSGANIALSYGMLGAFALAISASKIPDFFMLKLVNKVKENGISKNIKYYLIFGIFLIAVMSQNLFPIHISFIPILIPPLLSLFNLLEIDRRVIAMALTTGLTATYLAIPVGFGDIYLKQVLAHNLHENGLNISSDLMSKAMLIPVIGMLVGFIIAIFRYSGKRKYNTAELKQDTTVNIENNENIIKPKKFHIFATCLALIVSLVVQLLTKSMIACSSAGFLVLLVTGTINRRDSDIVFTDGMKVMATCGFIMIAAAGFAEVLRVTGDIPKLVNWTVEIIGNSKGIGAFIMLLVGLAITMGIGSSFSTVPIIASIYVPLALSLGFSPLAIATLVGAAGALGDAGSPASDSTIGPTLGLNVDGGHDHIRDSVIPSFIYLNIPMIIFSWIAVMIL